MGAESWDQFFRVSLGFHFVSQVVFTVVLIRFYFQGLLGFHVRRTKDGIS